MLLCSLYRISLPSHFVQRSVCGLCFEGCRNLVNLPFGICTLVSEVGPEVCTLFLSWSVLWLLWTVTRACPGYSGLFPPCSVVVSALWWCLLPAWWNRAPRSESLLWFWSVVPGRWDWGTPTGREVTEYYSSRNVPLRVCSGVLSHAFCKLSCYEVLALLLSPP